MLDFALRDAHPAGIAIALDAKYNAATCGAAWHAVQCIYLGGKHLPSAVIQVLFRAFRPCRFVALSVCMHKDCKVAVLLTAV